MKRVNGGRRSVDVEVAGEGWFWWLLNGCHSRWILMMSSVPVGFSWKDDNASECLVVEHLSCIHQMVFLYTLVYTPIKVKGRERSFSLFAPLWFFWSLSINLIISSLCVGATYSALCYCAACHCRLFSLFLPVEIVRTPISRSSWFLLDLLCRE